MRYTAIVLAGAASLSLTVAAGAYIVNQLPDTKQTRQPQAAPTPATPEVITGGPSISDAALTGVAFDLPVSFRLPVQAAAYRTELTPELASAAPTAAPTLPVVFAGRVRLGPTYVGAHLAPVRSDAVAFTLDTNALTALSSFLLADPARERQGVTQLRTEVDTHTGEVLVTFSDPGLGEHGLLLDRHPAPAAATPEYGTNATQYGTTAPQRGSTAPKYSAAAPKYVATEPNYTALQEISPANGEPSDLVTEPVDPEVPAPAVETAADTIIV